MSNGTILSPAEVSLKDFLLRILDERDLRFENRFAALDDSQKESMNAAEKAILKAEAANEKRFQSMNEFRSQLADQQATFVRKAEVDIRLEGLEKKIDAIFSQLQMTKGRDTGISSFAAALAVITSIVISMSALVVSILTRH